MELKSIQHREKKKKLDFFLIDYINCSKNAVKDAIFLQICKGNGMGRTRVRFQDHISIAKDLFFPPLLREGPENLASRCGQRAAGRGISACGPRVSGFSDGSFASALDRARGVHRCRTGSIFPVQEKKSPAQPFLQLLSLAFPSPTGAIRYKLRLRLQQRRIPPPAF